MRHHHAALRISAILATAMLGAGLLVAPTAVKADVIFSTLGPGHTYNPFSGSVVSGPNSIVFGNPNGAISQGNEFTSQGNYSVSQIDLGLVNFNGINAANVSVWTAANGLPQTQLGSWTVSNQPAQQLLSNNAITTISNIGGINLNAGSSYFLVVAPGGSNTFDGWVHNSIGATGTVVFNPRNTGWATDGTQTLEAFDLLGNPVSLPSTLFTASQKQAFSNADNTISLLNLIPDVFDITHDALGGAQTLASLFLDTSGIVAATPQAKTLLGAQLLNTATFTVDVGSIALACGSALLSAGVPVLDAGVTAACLFSAFRFGVDIGAALDRLAANDPPDLSYMSLFSPNLGPLPSSSQMCSTLDTMLGFTTDDMTNTLRSLQAMVVTGNRYSTALSVGDYTSAGLQLGAFGGFLNYYDAAAGVLTSDLNCLDTLENAAPESPSDAASDLSGAVNFLDGGSANLFLNSYLGSAFGFTPQDVQSIVVDSIENAPTIDGGTGGLALYAGAIAGTASVPEASSFAVLLGGLGTLFLVHARRRKKAFVLTGQRAATSL